MEDTIINLIFSTIESLIQQYPNVSWIGFLFTVLISICGVAAIATVWMPVPKTQNGIYAIVYRWVHGLAAHFKQNKGAIADGNSENIVNEVKSITGNKE